VLQQFAEARRGPCRGARETLPGGDPLTSSAPEGSDRARDEIPPRGHIPGIR